MKPLLLSIFLSVSFSANAEETDVTNIPSTALSTTSGIQYQIIQEGSGEHPQANSLVTVHYSGWTMDGNLFDSSYQRGQSISFSLQQVIQGWTEGVQLMTKGGKARFWIPEELAYKGQPGSPQGMLVFDIELIDFVNPPSPPSPLVPPQDAKTTTTGRPFLILSGESTSTTPTTTSKITLHYNIWSASGELEQSTVLSKTPLTMALSDLQPEWQEVLLQMKENDRVLLWYLPQASSLQSYRNSPIVLYEMSLIQIH